MAKPTKQQRVLDYLKSGQSLTPREAIALFNCYRLAAVVFKLKELGHNIVAVTEHNSTSHWAKYSLPYSHGFNRSALRRTPEEEKALREVIAENMRKACS